MRSLIFAIQFLTRLPLPLRIDYGPETFAASAKWFPLVGALVGAAVAGALALGARLDPWLAALLALAMWVWITGGLHLDGLSDLADALGGAHRDPERLLAIMRDPHAGVFGIITLWFALTAKLILLMLLAKQPQGWLLVLAIPAWARLGPVIWSQTLPVLGSGMGSRVATAPQPILWIVWLALLGAASWWVSPALLVAPLVLALWWLFLKLRVGGMNGDCLGAGIEVVETALILCAVLGEQAVLI